MPTLIDHLKAREVLDSRGYPTVECLCYLTSGEITTASVPSGASTGSHETLELRDQDQSRYHGKGVLKAVEHVNQILSPLVKGEDPTVQEPHDQHFIEADGTPNKSKLGANAILSASMAIAKAGALVKKIPLYQHLADLAHNDHVLKIPALLLNIYNGGLHGGMNLDFQEFIITPSPTRFPKYTEQLAIGASVYHQLHEVLHKNSHPTTVGDEGGYAPTLSTNRMAIDFVKQAVEGIGLVYGQDVSIGIDFAANTYFRNDTYKVRDMDHPLSQQEYHDYLINLVNDYAPYSFEDLLPEDSWELWQQFTKEVGDRVVIIGDDLLVTDPKRLQQAIDTKACNAILIKPNQIGSVTEAIRVVNLAKQHGFKTITSHRSGETNDTFIADFAVGLGTDLVKFGAPARGERIGKYNRLLEIAEVV